MSQAGSTWMSIQTDRNQISADDGSPPRSLPACSVPVLPGALRRELHQAALSAIPADAARADDRGDAATGATVESLYHQPPQLHFDNPVFGPAHARRPLPLLLRAL